MSPALLVQVRRFIATLNFSLVKDGWRNKISSLPCGFLYSEVCLVDFLTVGFALLIRVQRIYFLFNFHLAHTFFSVFFNSKNNLFSYIF